MSLIQYLGWVGRDKLQGNGYFLPVFGGLLGMWRRVTLGHGLAGCQQDRGTCQRWYRLLASVSGPGGSIGAPEKRRTWFEIEKNVGNSKAALWEWGC